MASISSNFWRSLSKASWASNPFVELLKPVGASSGLSLALSSTPAETESIITKNQPEATEKTESRQSAVCLLCFLGSLLFLVSLPLGRSGRGKRVEMLLIDILLGARNRSSADAAGGSSLVQGAFRMKATDLDSDP